MNESTEARPPAARPLAPERSMWFDLLYLAAGLTLGGAGGMAIMSYGWGERCEHNERAALRAEIAALRIDVDAMRRYLMGRPADELIPPTALPTAPAPANP